MYDYIKAYPDTSLFVCYGSRCKDGLPQSLAIAYEDLLSIKDHISIAQSRINFGITGKSITRSVAGFLMLFSVATWKAFPFDEGRRCLTVDTNFSKRILQAGGKILLMESIYIWHTYRLMEGKKSIKHLL
jgi:GT2 family glycosyltransferase